MNQILFVSSEQDIFKTLELSFSENGLTTQWTGTAENALHLIAEKKFDLVILHEQLPDMTGRKLVEKIITLNAMMNCVVLSALPKEEFHEVYEGLGVLMQFPLNPGKDEAEALFNHLTRIRLIAERVKPFKGAMRP